MTRMTRLFADFSILKNKKSVKICVIRVIRVETIHAPSKKMKMKILLISPAHPLRGGIATSTERLAQEMQNIGHEVVIYSFSLQYPEFLFPGKTQFTTDPPPAELEIHQKINSLNPFNWWQVARQIARHEQPDQIIVRFWLPFFAPCLGSILRLARLFSKKKIRRTALVDNIIPHEKRFGDRFLAKFFVRSCDDFVVMSRSVSEEIRSFLRKKRHNRVRFSPHPIYDNYGTPVEKTAARLALGLPPDAPLVLFFGFIRAYKGLDLLFEAMGEDNLRQQNVQAVVAGECYENWEKYLQIIENQRLGERVHLFTDFIAAEQVRYFFSAADLVVQPYRSATQSGISQIAYHFDKPMVVTDVGGLPEIVSNGKSGYVVEPSAEAISEAIFDFFENERAEEFSEGVRLEKERFSWTNLVGVLFEKVKKGRKK